MVGGLYIISLLNCLYPKYLRPLLPARTYRWSNLHTVQDPLPLLIANFFFVMQIFASALSLEQYLPKLPIRPRGQQSLGLSSEGQYALV